MTGSPNSLPGADRLNSTIQQEYKILAEYKMIQSENLSGIYTIPSFESSFEWFGVIFVRDGIYRDGIFRFLVKLSDKFPEDSSVPEIVFEHNVYHPLICPSTGLLNTRDAFPEWNATENHIWQLLKYIQYVFEKPLICLDSVLRTSPGQSINYAAMKLLDENRAHFILAVKECVRDCREKVYLKPAKEDKHYIAFEKFDSDVHVPVLESIRTRTDASLLAAPSPPVSGLSWVKGGDFKPLSKPED